MFMYDLKNRLFNFFGNFIYIYALAAYFFLLFLFNDIRQIIEASLGLHVDMS
jgi:hypothetical protein